MTASKLQFQDLLDSADFIYRASNTENLPGALQDICALLPEMKARYDEAIVEVQHSKDIIAAHEEETKTIGEFIANLTSRVGAESSAPADIFDSIERMKSKISELLGELEEKKIELLKKEKTTDGK